jgi:hypothetical protein
MATVSNGEWRSGVADGSEVAQSLAQMRNKEQAVARKTTPEKPPTRTEASIAGRALRTGKATAAQIRSMAGRIESERAAVKRSKKR